MSDGGKGDTQRPTDAKAFGENLEKVFGVKVPWYVRRDREQQQQQQKGQTNDDTSTRNL